MGLYVYGDYDLVSKVVLSYEQTVSITISKQLWERKGGDDKPKEKLWYI